MKQTMTYYPVRDFAKVRIACHNQVCRAVLELDLAKVEPVFEKTKAHCPVCGHPFFKAEVNGGADVVTQLAKAVLALNQLASQVGIEFPVPQESGASGQQPVLSR